MAVLRESKMINGDLDLYSTCHIWGSACDRSLEPGQQGRQHLGPGTSMYRVAPKK